MRIFRTALGVIAALVAAAAAASGCSATAGSPRGIASPGDAGTQNGGDGGAGFDSGAVAPRGTTSGIVIVHASPNLGAFRLCFSGGGDLLPMPDRELMPQSNVVGVEVGGAVRIPALASLKINTAPTRVTAILERSLRSKPANAPCSALVCPVGVTGGDCLTSGEYFELGAAPSGLVQAGVHLLVVSGCVPGSGDGAACGTGFSQSTGNVKLSDIPIQPSFTGRQGLDVQLAQLSPAVERGGNVTVKFGALPTPNADLPVNEAFGEVGSPAFFELDRGASAVYSQQGFLVDTGAVKVAQSLASIQALSQPDQLPTDFYAVPSSFVLLLLGEPAQTNPTGGPGDAGVDPGRALHLLAVPVTAPEPDAGAPDAEPYDANRPD